MRPDRNGRRRIVKRAASVSLLAAAAGIGYSRFAVPHDLNLPPATGGERRAVHRRAGPLAYYVAGEGPPLLLVHSINAAASAHEVGPIFEALRAKRRVYAVDLPGYGFSDRSDRRYDVPLFVDALRDTLDEIEKERGPVPVDALAVSLGCEFLARLAAERPQRFRTLTLVTPTGFSRMGGGEGPPGSNREIPGLYGFFTFPVWSQAFYDLLVSRVSVRYFLQRTFGSKNVPDDLVDYSYATAHQPGARHAPYAFVSGRLFSRDIGRIYDSLTMPIWMPHATRGDFKDFSRADRVARKPNWRVEPWPTGALPHFELTSEFTAALEQFLDSAPAPVADAQESASGSAARSPSP